MNRKLKLLLAVCLMLAIPIVYATWPGSDVATTNLDSGTDDPRLARADILDLTQKVNQIRNHVSSFMQGHLDDTDAAAARATLGSTTVGDAVFIASNSAAGRTALGLGSMSTQGSSSILVTGGDISGVNMLGNAWYGGTLDGTSSTVALNGNFNGNGVLGGSIVSPLARMRRTEVTATNGSTVSVTVAGGEVVVSSANLGTVVTGDRIWVSWKMAVSKGGTAGRSLTRLLKVSGTAAIGYYDNETTALYGESMESQTASTTRVLSGSGIIKVTTGGTLTIGIYAQSVGSDATVNTGGGQLLALVLVGT